MVDGDTDDTGLARLQQIIDSGVLTGPVVHDSRHVEPGSLYACLRGEHFDGHDFAAAAVAAGAAALLTDHELDGIAAAQIVVDDTRLRLGPISAAVAGNPSRSLTAVGITGTNGKTTTAQMLASILEAVGRPTGVVGTLHGTRTTPEAPELQRTLRGFVDDGKSAAVLEVSSHALALHRVDGTEFDAVVFTNLGHDHLDLHGSREEYFRAKASLFTQTFAPVGIVNVDDTHGRLLADTAADDDDFRIVPFSVDDLTDVVVTASSHGYTWRNVQIDVPIGGRFNVSNSLAALTTAGELGVDPAVAARGLASLPPVPGRFEVVDSPVAAARGITVVVDYAHTPEGLDEVLTTSRSVTSVGASVIVVFGCGGDRDRRKRPEMGAVSARLADRVVVTSDNPRHESATDIIDEILAGIEPGARSRVTTDPDRQSAIAAALAMAERGDVVVIAGKGHERTQEFADGTIDFDDRAVVRESLRDAT